MPAEVGYTFSATNQKSFVFSLNNCTSILSWVDFVFIYLSSILCILRLFGSTSYYMLTINFVLFL